MTVVIWIVLPTR